MYFSWLGFYTKALAPLALIGFVTMMLQPGVGIVDKYRDSDGFTMGVDANPGTNAYTVFLALWYATAQPRRSDRVDLTARLTESRGQVQHLPGGVAAHREGERVPLGQRGRAGLGQRPASVPWRYDGEQGDGPRGHRLWQRDFEADQSASTPIDRHPMDCAINL
jgi:hypothetical protein